MTPNQSTENNDVGHQITGRKGSIYKNLNSLNNKINGSNFGLINSSSSNKKYPSNQMKVVLGQK